MFLEEKPEISEADSSYIRNKVDAILDVQEEIDQTIMKICTGWRLERLGKTELAILRLAVYEMLKDDDIPKEWLLTRRSSWQRFTAAKMHQDLSTECWLSWHSRGRGPDTRLARPAVVVL